VIYDPFPFIFLLFLLTMFTLLVYNSCIYFHTSILLFFSIENTFIIQVSYTWQLFGEHLQATEFNSKSEFHPRELYSTLLWGLSSKGMRCKVIAFWTELQLNRTWQTKNKAKCPLNSEYPVYVGLKLKRCYRLPHHH
jgi:hypothetical protein